MNIEGQKPFRRSLVLHAARWVSNIMVEVLANHGETLPDKARNILRDVVSKLEELQQVIRTTKD